MYIFHRSTRSALRTDCTFISTGIGTAFSEYRRQYYAARLAKCIARIFLPANHCKNLAQLSARAASTAATGPEYWFQPHISTISESTVPMRVLSAISRSIVLITVVKSPPRLCNRQTPAVIEASVRRRFDAAIMVSPPFAASHQLSSAGYNLRQLSPTVSASDTGHWLETSLPANGTPRCSTLFSGDATPSAFSTATFCRADNLPLKMAALPIIGSTHRDSHHRGKSNKPR